MDSVERYDRQIRLWGQHGQAKCSNAKICLVNADSLGIEIMRGLCLAGVGSFVILDSQKFSHEDIGSSFIKQSRTACKRGEEAKAMLLNINEKTHCEIYPIEQKDDLFWRQFSCVIISGNLCTSQINQISNICWANDIPFIRCRSIGFYGYMRTQLKDHTVTDTHPEWKPPKSDSKEPVISTAPVYQDYEQRTCNLNGEDNEEDLIGEFVCLKALDLFFTSYGRLPGHSNDQVETDISKLKDSVKKLLGKSHSQLKNLDQCLYEMCRYGGAELHITSAFIGGCIAQEVIKIITNQYIPVEDTLVYNAMTATTRTFKCNEVLARSTP